MSNIQQEEDNSKDELEDPDNKEVKVEKLDSNEEDSNISVILKHSFKEEKGNLNKRYSTLL